MTCRQRVKLPSNLLQLNRRRLLGPVPFWDRSSPSPPGCWPPLYEVNHQRRCLVSFPHYMEQRTAASRVRSNNSNIPGCVANAHSDSRLISQAIVLAAEEANRLLEQSAKHHLYYKSKAVTPTNNDARLSDQDESIRIEVVDAANKLLLVSAPLQEKIGVKNLLLEEERQQYTQYISVLHRAFLALTAKCLDAIRIIQDSSASTSTEHAETLLDLSLSLARRAHSLGLPLHLPLIQQLMEVTAITLKYSTDPVASVLLKLASDASALNTSVPLNGALFRPSLLALIANKQFNDVVDLLHGMRDHHGLTTLDRATVTEIYTSLHAVVKSSFCVRLESRRDLPESPITEAVAILEPSIVLFCEEWTNEAKLKQDKLRHLLDSIDEYKMESLISSLSDQAGNVDDDEIELIDSDDETDEYHYDDSDLVMITAKSINPLDQAVNAILAKRVKSEKVKAIMADMVHAASSGSGSSLPSYLPKIITVTANLTPDERENVDYWAGECSDLSSDEDSDSDNEQEVVPWMKSRRSQFPDISTQIVELNNGRDFRFTRNYEEQIWMNEDVDHFHDGMENMYSRSLDESDDENDDDSDGDDDPDDYR